MNLFKKTSLALATLCTLVSLSACDLMGDPNGGDCYIDADYRISCESAGEGTLVDPNG